MSCCSNGIFVPLIMDCDGTIRTMRPGETLRIQDEVIGRRIISITSDTELTESTVVLADATSGAITVTLPPGFGGLYCSVKKIDSSSNYVTVDGYGSETLDDQSSAVITTQYTNLTFLFFNGEWWIM